MKPLRRKGFPYILALSMATLSACATHPPEPVVRTVEVKVPVGVPCPDRRAPAPIYPDTPEAIAAAPDVFTLAQLYVAGRLLRIEREQEDNSQIAACKPSP